MTRWFLWLGLLLIASFQPTVSAYTLSPSQITLRASGSDSSAFLRLENKAVAPTAVEISIQEHHKDLDGNTIAGAAAEDAFIVYPSQLVMMSGDEVGVQVRWIGEPSLGAEQAYTLVAREVPIPREAVPESASGVRVDVTVLMNYEGRIYVTPAGAKPRVVVESVSERPADGSEQAASSIIEVILSNQGTAHQDLSQLSFVVVPVDAAGTLLRQRAVMIAARQVPGTRPHLLAGDRRRLRIARPQGLPAGPVHVLLSQ